VGAAPILGRIPQAIEAARSAGTSPAGEQNIRYEAEPASAGAADSWHGRQLLITDVLFRPGATMA